MAAHVASRATPPASLSSSQRSLGATQQQPSAYGYKTSLPLHRDAQKVLTNRDQREKTRVAAGDVLAPTNPLVSQPHGAGFASDSDRFTRDVATKLAEQEQCRKEAKTHCLRDRKEQRTQREIQRWKKMDDEEQRATLDAKLIAGTGMRNKGSVGYNLVSGGWGNSLDAARAKYIDDNIEYSAKLRTLKLDTRGNSNFNILTGEPRNVVVLPPVPSYKPPPTDDG